MSAGQGEATFHPVPSSDSGPSAPVGRELREEGVEWFFHAFWSEPDARPCDQSFRLELAVQRPDGEVPLVQLATAELERREKERVALTADRDRVVPWRGVPVNQQAAAKRWKPSN